MESGDFIHTNIRGKILLSLTPFYSTLFNGFQWVEYLCPIFKLESVEVRFYSFGRGS